jgi:hypothetical protein
MATELIWSMDGMRARGKMASHAVLRSAVDSLLDALEIRPKEFLPTDSDPSHPFIPRLDFNRGNAYEVIKGEKPLSPKMAHKLRKRLQIMLEFAIDDREELGRIITERSRYERAPAAEREAMLRMLLGAAIRERSAPAMKIAARRGVLQETKALHSARSGMYQILLLEQLDAIIAERMIRGNLAQLEQRLAELCAGPESLLAVNKGRFDIVDEKTILRRFGPRVEGLASQRDADRSSGMDRVFEVTWRESPELFPREQLLRFAEILRKNGFEVIEVQSAREGCTTTTLRARADDVAGVMGVIGEDQLRQMGIVSLREEPESSRPDDSKEPIAERAREATIKGPQNPIEQQLRAALRREFLVRPWRRLRYLFAPAVARTPQWHTIAESDDRAYAHPLVSENLRALRVDLSMILVWWPLLTALALTLALLPMPAHATTMGILCGLALAMAGAQPCSLLVSPLACGAGVLAMGFSFGVVQAMIAERINLAMLVGWPPGPDNLFLSVDGGLIGLSAPAWHSVFSWGQIAVITLALALSISVAGWLMGQPQRARQRVNHHTRGEEIGGALLGAASGLGIGLVYALDCLFRMCMPQPFALSMAFSLIGGAWIGLSTYLRFGRAERTKRRTRALVTAIVHALLAMGVVACAFWSSGSSGGPIVLAASCGFFQSTFFTAAFVIAHKIGGVRAAFGATTLEGAVGFAAFVIARVLHG